LAERMLDRMTGAADGVRDAILGHTQAETGGFYFCPPLRDGRLDLALPASAAAPSPAGAFERVTGTQVSILFEARRCIHSRNCVLSRPDVFVPNVEGAWLHPERASGAEIAALAQACPSGAIKYERHDGGAPEAPPNVNVVRVLENGPLAIRAEATIGAVPALRATLCRCGGSAAKPYCDGSHHRIEFRATGEPEPRAVAALDRRDGPLSIEPVPDGPLLLDGALEIVSGTGRTIFRGVEATLCRCGQSRRKPFCDGSHAGAGFRAE
ncbi:MAG TPA: CDGSH iron-sulfur domain-containing protein, partial [Alphaproteobacteria bacterium]